MEQSLAAVARIPVDNIAGFWHAMVVHQLLVTVPSRFVCTGKQILGKKAEPF
jgi:hypothetical protein